MPTRITKAEAARLGLTRKRREDREAKVYDTLECWVAYPPDGGIMVQLPYPPSVNRVWRNYRGRMVMSADGRAYRAAVADVFSTHAPHWWQLGKYRLKVSITLAAPDNRRRDIDNSAKVILDSLQHIRVYDDDSQIDDLRFIRGPVSPPGWVRVTIQQMEGA